MEKNEIIIFLSLLVFSLLSIFYSNNKDECSLYPNSGLVEYDCGSDFCGAQDKVYDKVTQTCVYP